MKVFHGFSQDMVEDFTGLKSWHVKTLREHGVVKPEREAGGYLYSFADILMMRLVRDLRERYEIALKNIIKAHEFLSDIDPDEDLRKHQLYIWKPRQEILYLGPKYDEQRALINASQFGQLVIEGAISILPVGERLDSIRQRVIGFDERLDRSLHSQKFTTLDELKKRYAAG